MYLAKQKVQAVQREVCSEQKERSMINAAKHKVGTPLSYNEVCIQFSRTPPKEGTQQETLNRYFLELECRIMEIYSKEDIKAENPDPAISLWRTLRDKLDDKSGRMNITKADLAKLESAIPRNKKKKSGPVQKMPPEHSNATAGSDHRDEVARRLLGKPDEDHSYGTMPCRKGSKLLEYLVENKIVGRDDSVFIGHQRGRSKGAKRFVVVIREQNYLIFMARHCGNDNKKYRVTECMLSDLGYKIDSREIHIVNNSLVFNDGTQI